MFPERYAQETVIVFSRRLARPAAVDGVKCGVWAATKDLDYEDLWTITHLPTGGMVDPLLRLPKETAVAAARLFERHAPTFGAHAAFGSQLKRSALRTPEGRRVQAVIGAVYARQAAFYRLWLAKHIDRVFPSWRLAREVGHAARRGDVRITVGA